ncbi:hypothetical protein LY76DRAFT_48479 [Colletotrichum caudatum]|nr:hypothetical protein LY76DRAFT_48479 [Colletotrichum caudatum]
MPCNDTRVRPSQLQPSLLQRKGGERPQRFLPTPGSYSLPRMAHDAPCGCCFLPWICLGCLRVITAGPLALTPATYNMTRECARLLDLISHLRRCSCQSRSFPLSPGPHLHLGRPLIQVLGMGAWGSRPLPSAAVALAGPPYLSSYDV